MPSNLGSSRNGSIVGKPMKAAAGSPSAAALSRHSNAASMSPRPLWTCIKEMGWVYVPRRSRRELLQYPLRLIALPRDAVGPTQPAQVIGAAIGQRHGLFKDRHGLIVTAEGTIVRSQHKLAVEGIRIDVHSFLER